MIVLLVFAINGYCQFSFTASPGINLNSAYFGYKINDKLVPHIGIQYVLASGSFNYSDNTPTDKVSASLLIPTIGIKYFALKTNKIRGYFNLDITKPVINGKITGSDSSDANQEYQDALDNISIWGTQFGFGVEYFFDNNFSIGGEYGIRYFHLKYNNADQLDSNISNVGFALSPTYSRISLNYYF